MENTNFLKERYNLHSSPEVGSSIKRTEMRTGEKVSQNPAERIQNYLERLKSIFEIEDPTKKERVVKKLKNILYEKFVIKENDIPESYFEIQRNFAKEQGYGDIKIERETRRQLSEVIITDQKSSLDNWLNYLSSDDAIYPDWFKYWVFRSAMGIGKYDKERKQFTKRDQKTTIAPFSDINREALAHLLDIIEKKYSKSKIEFESFDENQKKEFGKFLQNESFAKLYAFAIEEVDHTSTERMAIVEGKWIKYDKGSDYIPLVKSLSGFGTGWCTVGESTAKNQLKGGDFYVYYSIDENGVARIPRVAIRMQDNKIAEIRGIAEQQNLDPYIGDVVKNKLLEFPDGSTYEKKTLDMKLLTQIDKKTKAKQELVREELIFLYEINNKIEGFGFQRDPRIKEIKDARKEYTQKDAAIIFECLPEQIAWDRNEINEKTKVYIGPLFEGIFQKNIKNICSSFPEGYIKKNQIKIGGKSKNKLIENLKKNGVVITSWAKDLFESKDFSVSAKIEKITLVRLKIKDLGLKINLTTENIYREAKKIGLDTCPTETALHTESLNINGSCILIATKLLTDRFGDCDLFSLYDDNGILKLSGESATSKRVWDLDDKFIFSIKRKTDNN